MSKTFLFLASLSAALCFAGSPSDRALESLLRAGAAAETAVHGTLEQAAHSGAAAYDHAGASAVAVLVAPTTPGALAAAPPAARAPAVAPTGRISSGYLGLYPEGDFNLTTGRCASCRAPKEGLWYFLDDVIAVPKVGTPSLVWIGSRGLVEGASLSPDGRSLALRDGSAAPLSLVPKIASNRSYYDLSTTAFFRNRKLRVRGEWVEEKGVRRFVARTIWPEDFKVDFRAPPASVRDESGISRLVKADGGGARGAFQTEVLWEKTPGVGRPWGGKTVMGMMVNGSQGDDDEAQGGHFSAFTGRMGQGGEMADWMFSNFYDMDSVSEKGIIAALVPMDKYMADLNSGQSYYRPTALLVAVLKNDAPALRLQEKFKELYAKYYAHEVRYDHTTKSCTGLVMDEVRAGGWNVPKSGPSNVLSAGALSALAAVGGWDRKAGSDLWAVMRQERTRLYPRAAFEAVGADLLRLAGAQGLTPGRELTPFERELADDLEAVLFVRIPQIPSSRAYGSFAVGSTEEYFGRVPLSRSKWKIVPTGPRPFPPPH